MSMSGKQNVIIRFVRDSGDTDSNCDLKCFLLNFILRIYFSEFFFSNKKGIFTSKSMEVVSKIQFFSLKSFDKLSLQVTYFVLNKYEKNKLN